LVIPLLHPGLKPAGRAANRLAIFQISRKPERRAMNGHFQWTALRRAEQASFPDA
jgi:hypothetical protein